jgi:hypothetical protein
LLYKLSRLKAKRGVDAIKELGRVRREQETDVKFYRKGVLNLKSPKYSPQTTVNYRIMFLSRSCPIFAG